MNTETLSKERLAEDLTMHLRRLASMADGCAPGSATALNLDEASDFMTIQATALTTALADAAKAEARVAELEGQQKDIDACLSVIERCLHSDIELNWRLGMKRDDTKLSQSHIHDQIGNIRHTIFGEGWRYAWPDFFDYRDSEMFRMPEGSRRAALSTEPTGER